MPVDSWPRRRYLQYEEHFSRVKNMSPKCSPRILIVDDDETHIHYYRVLCKRLNIGAEVLPNCVKALDTIDEQACFDLVILDWIMPHASGPECLNLVKEKMREKNCPIVCISAFGFDLNEPACLKAGFDDFLQKPFSMEQFSVFLAKWLPSDEE